MRQYVLSVICAAAICGIVLGIVRDGAPRAVLKILCGAFLAVTVASPLAGADFERVQSFVFPDELAAERMTASGEKMARLSLAAIIKENTEAYILDKATAQHGDLKVEITVSDDPMPIPVAAVLTGRVSPYAKSQIETILRTDLGIPKENVRWML